MYTRPWSSGSSLLAGHGKMEILESMVFTYRLSFILNFQYVETIHWPKEELRLFHSSFPAVRRTQFIKRRSKFISATHFYILLWFNGKQQHHTLWTLSIICWLNLFLLKKLFPILLGTFCNVSEILLDSDPFMHQPDHICIFWINV